MRETYLLGLNWSLSSLGGVNEVVLNLQKYLAKEFDTRVLIPSWLPEGARSIEPAVVWGPPLREPLRRSNRWRSMLSFLLWLPRDMKTLRRIFQTHRVSVVNPHFPSLNILPIILLKQLGLYHGTLLLSVHGAEIFGALQTTGLERRLWKYCLESADAVISCATSLKHQVLEVAPGANVVVIRNGIHPDSFAIEAQNRHPIPDELRNKIYILNIGKFEHKKAQDVLIEAFERLSEDVYLVLVGATGPTRDEVRKRIESSPRAQRILIYENLPHEQIPALIAGARLFVLPSRREAFPVVLLEAAMCGAPVVATRVDGVPELITTGVNGVLVAPDDPQELASAITDMLRHPKEALRMADKLKEKVNTEFTWEHASATYLSLCRATRAGELG